MRRGDVVTTLLILTTLALSPTSLAASVTDNTAPVITHAPPLSCPGVGASVSPPCVVEAVIVDASGVFDPTLLVRLRGVSAYERVPMKAVDDKVDTFGATVPAAMAFAGDVEYLIEAFDLQGNGPARAGDEAAPLVLTKAIAAAPVMASVEPAVVEEDNGLFVGLAVAVGLVVVVVVGAGAAVAVYALRSPAVDDVTVSVSGPRPFTAVTP